MKEIKIYKVRGELNIKRFHFPGVIKVKCLECEQEMENDFDDQYLSYPSPGEETSIGFYCDNCDTEHSLPIKIEDISISISHDPDTLERDS